ncbi:MAG: hypothetical protein JXR83_04055 [Deltaproteobacteria bacterium]|nr:hypothetical protein [Deltaproteobacteria bacterium]
MGDRQQHGFDDATLERYLDGALPAAQERAVTAALDRDPELRRRVDEMLAVRALLKQELDAVAADVDWRAFANQVVAKCEAAPALPWGARLQAWLGEVFAYRKPVWVSSLAVAAAAAAVLLVPRLIDQPPDMRVADNSPDAQVEVQSLETGSTMAMVYQLPKSRTTVIWIPEHADSEEPD